MTYAVVDTKRISVQEPSRTITARLNPDGQRALAISLERGAATDITEAVHRGLELLARSTKRRSAA